MYAVLRNGFVFLRLTAYGVRVRRTVLRRPSSSVRRGTATLALHRAPVRRKVHGCVVRRFAKWVRFSSPIVFSSWSFAFAFAFAPCFATLYRVPVRRTVYGYVVRRFAKWVRFSSPTAYGVRVRRTVLRRPSSSVRHGMPDALTASVSTQSVSVVCSYIIVFDCIVCLRLRGRARRGFTGPLARLCGRSVK